MRGRVYDLHTTAMHDNECVAPAPKKTNQIGRPEDIIRRIRAELSRLVRRTNNRDGSSGGGERRSAALRVFESLDRDGSGRVSRRDFRRALRELGFDRLGDDEEAAEVLDHFDPNRYCNKMTPARSRLRNAKISNTRPTAILVALPACCIGCDKTPEQHGCAAILPNALSVASFANGGP